MNLRPLYDKIVIKLKDKQEIKSETGLQLIKDMSISTNATMLGEVIAIGQGRLLADGKIVPLIVKVGDIVLFSKMYGDAYNNGIDNYTILSESNILAVIQEDKNEDN